MPSTELSRPRRRRARLALVAALVAVGCSGSTGGGCASSCGGAFKTKDEAGNSIKFSGTRLDNVAQVRITRSGFTFLNADHLNDVVAALNNTSPGFSIPCIDAGTIFNACNVAGFIDLTRVHLIAGDSGLTGDPARCSGDAAQRIPPEKTPLHLTFKDVSWILDGAGNILRAHLVLHLKTGDIYVRTVEEHSSICGGTSAIQARVVYDDALPGLPQPYTTADLDIHFSTAPDGRLEFNFDDASLASVVANFQPAALVIDGNPGNDPAPPSTAPYNGDGCSSGSGTYSTLNGGALNCASVLNDLNAGCDVTQNNGGTCAIVQYIRGYLFDYVKNAFKAQIVKILRQQLDNMRCQRSTTSQGGAIRCDATHACPADDDGKALACDASRGVCYPPAQGLGADGYNCEPVQLGIAGKLDVSDLTEKVGFPPKTALNLFAALGSKSKNGAARVDDNGLQMAVEAGTQPATDSNYLGVCVPPALVPAGVAVPPMDFDTNKPSAVTSYDVGFSLASEMLNRGFLDAYSAGMLCVAITNQTTAFISSGLFKTFLPSLGLLTSGKDVPMKILLRPTQPPYVRIGKNTTMPDANGNQVPDDPLITLAFKEMNLDFYALVDERQVRIFTLQADLKLPLDLRTFPDPNADTLQPVLGGLDTVLTNVSALSPDGGAYSATADMLAEDPGVVKDLLGAAVRLAQPLLAGVIKPIALPTMMGLKLSVRGVAGAVPKSDLAAGGYDHLAVWAQMGACGGATGVLCGQYTVKAQARVARSYLPDSLREVKAGARPELELELSALTARSGARAQYSYRVDGSMWSPWLGGSKLALRDALFLVQGHHTVEVTAREAGDDHTMDPHPVALDFFVTYEPPEVSLAQRADGALVTRARSGATPVAKLAFSYRIDGTQSWTQAGPPRVFTQDELGGRGLSVSASDEAGRAAQAHFGDEDGTGLARAGVTGGCATGTHQTAWSLLPLLALAFLRRQRKGSSSLG
jgi:hypothetical protein